MVYLGIIKMHKSFSLECKHTHTKTGGDRDRQAKTER